MRSLRILALTLIVTLATGLAPASAYNIDENNKIFGMVQVIWVLDETAEKGSNVTDPDGEAGADTAFGFKARRFRLGFKGTAMEDLLYYKVQLGFAKTAGVVDYWFGINFLEGDMSLQFGQFIPFLTETASNSASRLKNIDRATGVMGVTSAFFVQNYREHDRGAMLKFNKAGGIADIFLSVTNGTGGNASVGGDYSKGDVYSNNTGDAAYVIGAVVKPVQNIRLTASYGINQHDQMVYKGADEAIDVDRSLMSVSARYTLKDMGLYVDGEYAVLQSGDGDTAYHGAEKTAWYGRVAYFIMPDKLEVVARYAVDADSGVKSGSVDNEFVTNQISTGFNYFLGKQFKSQLEYNVFQRDEGDDLTSIRMMFQMKF